MLRKWVPWWIIPILISFATGTVWLRLMIVRITYSIGETNRSIDRARQERELAQLRVSALRSPRKLELLARTKFGLGQPKVEQVVHLKVLQEQ